MFWEKVNTDIKILLSFLKNKTVLSQKSICFLSLITVQKKHFTMRHPVCYLCMQVYNESECFGNLLENLSFCVLKERDILNICAQILQVTLRFAKFILKTDVRPPQKQCPCPQGIIGETRNISDCTTGLYPHNKNVDCSF